MAKQVRAVSEGFYGGIRRRVGDVFKIDDSKKIGKWMEPVKQVAKPEGEKPDGKVKPPATDKRGASLLAGKNDGLANDLV